MLFPREPHQVIGWLLAVLLIAPLMEAGDYVAHTVPIAPDSVVWLDGVPAGITDENGRIVLGATPGNHRVRVEKGGAVLADTSIEFDEIVNLVEIWLQRAPAANPDSSAPARLTIVTNVGGAAVSLNGEHVASTDPQTAEAELGLQAGVLYEVAISSPGFVTEIGRLRPGPGPQRWAVILQREKGSGQSSGIPLFVLILVGVTGLTAAGAMGFVGLRRSRGRKSGTGRSGPKPALKGYRADSVIGRGGIATIYRGIELATKRPVALKVLDEKWLSDREMVHKFISEADALRAVSNADPSAPVVRVLGAGRGEDESSGLPFIALELLEGVDLAALLSKNATMPESTAVGISIQICHALVVMHRAGVVHRDLTPDNIFVVGGTASDLGRVLDGVPRLVLIDFGVAKQEYLARVTMDGSIAGKPPYMSPEQCRGQAVDFRSDLYALGLLLYAMIEGVPPFIGDNPFDVMRAQQHQPPPPMTHLISPKLRELVQQLLEKEPGKRPLSPEVVLVRLREIWSEREHAH